MPSSALTVVPPGRRPRHPIAPPAISGELVRLRVIELLARTLAGHRHRASLPAPASGSRPRWRRRCGRTRPTLQGIDAWVSCEPGDEDADHFAAAILACTGRATGGHDGAAAIVHALGDLSPVPVCVVVDDVHRLPERSSSMKLLGDAPRAPPASRSPRVREPPHPAAPTGPLACGRRRRRHQRGHPRLHRRRDRRLARQRGHDPAGLEDLAGWPALVHLALVAPPGAPRQFLWEEVVAAPWPATIAPRSSRSRQLGTADATSLTELCGEPVDVDHLVNTIPLVVHTGNGEVRAHDLWNATLPTIVPARGARRGEPRRLRPPARARGRTAGRARWRPASAMPTPCARPRSPWSATRCRRSPLTSRPRWLRAAPIDQRDRPELLLLDAALRHADSNPDAECLAAPRRRAGRLPSTGRRSR